MCPPIVEPLFNELVIWNQRYWIYVRRFCALNYLFWNSWNFQITQIVLIIRYYTRIKKGHFLNLWYSQKLPSGFFSKNQRDFEKSLESVCDYILFNFLLFGGKGSIDLVNKSRLAFRFFLNVPFLIISRISSAISFDFVYFSTIQRKRLKKKIFHAGRHFRIKQISQII